MTTTIKSVTNWVSRKVNVKLLCQVEVTYKVALEETLPELLRCVLVAVTEQKSLRSPVLHLVD